MRIALQLPTHRVRQGAEFVSGPAVSELARAAEAAGFDAVFVTDHPIPDVPWIEGGGHHSLDPFVALAAAGAATSRLRLMTNICVAPYRNPFLLAKAASSLDVMSGGRVVLGLGAGYLDGEFRALGVDMTRRNDATDEAIRVLRATWTGDVVVHEGADFTAIGNVSLPTPIQGAQLPIWVGGNSRRAVRRAVELGDGWIPFLNPATTALEGTSSLDDLAALASMIAYAHEHSGQVRRTAPLEVAFMPAWRRLLVDGAYDDLVGSAEMLAGQGVTYLLTALPAKTRAELIGRIDVCGENLVPRLEPVTTPGVMPA